jgi:hypothetical protein
MLNYYRRYMIHEALHQATLHNVLSVPEVKGFHAITWTSEIHEDFENYTANFSRAILLAHRDPSAPLTLVTHASTTAMGAVLQRRVKNAWKPLTFFSKNLNPAQQKYSAYDRELLAIYEV